MRRIFDLFRRRKMIEPSEGAARGPRTASVAPGGHGSDGDSVGRKAGIAAEADGMQAPVTLAEPAPAGSTPAPKDIEAWTIEILRSTFDPEIPVNIYELGLVYEVKVDDSNGVRIKMTLTSPACPVAGSLPPEVEAKVRAIPGVTSASIDLVWDPPWDPSMMSEAARLQLGMM